MYYEFSQNNNSPIVCNVPHSGTFIPEEFKKDFLIADEVLNDEVKYMADMYTDVLYEELLSVSSFIKSNISRIVVDIERFKNEDEEPMSKVGMSAFYIRTSKGEILRSIPENNVTALDSLYDEYHKSFTGLVNSSLLKNNTVIIVDCHSFPSIPRSYEPDQNVPRPDICIGIDEYHTPLELIAILKRNFELLGYSTATNTPFSGSIVPLQFYKKDKRVVSVMIEVNRKLYMNEETYNISKNFREVSKNISRCVIKSLNEFTK